MVLHWIAQKYYKRRAKMVRKKAKIAKKLLARMLDSDPKSIRYRLFSRLTASLALTNQVGALSGYAGVSRPVCQLTDDYEYQSEAPREIGTVPLRHSGTNPAIMARLFSDACINSGSSAILTKQAIGIPRLYIGRPDLLITDPVFLLLQQNGSGIVHCPDPKPLESGVAVFGSGATNWYHWLIEVLPAAFLAESLPEQYASFPLLLPETCGKPGTFMDSAALFGKGRALVVLPGDTNFRVADLIAIDPVVQGPMNLREGSWPGIADYSQNADVLRAYRAAILDRLGLAPAPPSRRIFLARSNDRRSFNQDDLISIAESHGFEAVYPERMSFREQVLMYAEAEFLLGASGAAFANMLFCQPGARSLIWMLPQYREFCAYSNLAAVTGVDLNYLFVTPLIPINSSFDAYSAPYSLEPADFGDALGRIMSGTR